MMRKVASGVAAVGRGMRKYPIKNVERSLRAGMQAAAIGYANAGVSGFGFVGAAVAHGAIDWGDFSAAFKGGLAGSIIGGTVSA